MHTDDGAIAEKRIIWDNEFSLRYIEVVADVILSEEELIIEFSSKEVVEKFEGIIINGF